MGTFDALAGLRVSIDGYSLEPLHARLPSGWERSTTMVRLHGRGEVGLGEDVTYSSSEQRTFRELGHGLPLAGVRTLKEFSRALESLPLWPREPEQEASRHYRRWAFEGAALDLALRQSGLGLAESLSIEPRAVRFVVSTDLGGGGDPGPLRLFLERHPTIRLKLDATSSWSEPLIADLARIGAIDTVDLKGAYRGTPVDQPADPALYRRILRGLPHVWIEDPALTPETLPILEPHRTRLTWDAPIHSVSDIEALRFTPRVLNFKPSRFGTLESLLDAYDYCGRRGIGIYGGGQLELGVGRGQIQYLASLFHPDAPNDVAPSGYNISPTSPDLPESPLTPAPAPIGFRWRE